DEPRTSGGKVGVGAWATHGGGDGVATVECFGGDGTTCPPTGPEYQNPCHCCSLTVWNRPKWCVGGQLRRVASTAAQQPTARIPARTRLPTVNPAGFSAVAVGAARLAPRNRVHP